jgi:4-hydroxybenzoate polyprenyltransferase
MKRESKELILSSITVILVAIAISVFIYTGGGYIFYIVAIPAFITGIINFWLLSTDNNSALRENKAAAHTGARRSRRANSKSRR